MAKEQKEKAKKLNKLTASQKQSLAIIFFLVLIVVYIGSQCYSVMNVRLQTQTALISTVYEEVEATALVVRDEHIVSPQGGSVNVPSVSNGEKVKNGGELAKDYGSAENAPAYAEYHELEQELAYYAQMESQAVGQVTDVESLDADILQNVNSYIRANAAMDFQQCKDYSSQLNDKFTRRQMLIGQDIDFASIVTEITSEMDAININSCKPVGYISADASGIFSDYTDGLEQAYDFKNVEEITPEMLEGYIEGAKDAVPTDDMGKLVTSFDWYMLAVVEREDVAELKNGDKVDIAIKGTDRVITCKIVSGADTDLSADKSVLILKSSEMNSDIASMRVENIQIRTKEYTGIKVSPNAVHIKDGEKGVYALVSSVVEWRKADVLYTGKDYVVLNYSTEESGGIKLYDEIIIKGKELHDGKVYT